MLQATPFDLCLFTGTRILPAGDLALQHLHARDLFTWCSQQVNDTNSRFHKNPALQGYRLALPMTEQLFETLQNTPSWQEVHGRAALHEHKAQVMRFLISNNHQGGSPILHLERDNAHIYTVTMPADFFTPEIPNELQSAWAEASGTCIFGNAQMLKPTEAAIISAGWVISPGRGQRPGQLEMQLEYLVVCQSYFDM